MTEPQEPDYGNRFVTFHQSIWGEGYLSPGGSAEVDLALTDVDLTGKDVLDIGCGTGGIDVHIVKAYNPRQVTAIDIEPYVLARAQELIEKKGLEGKISLQQVRPGPLPFEDRTFDVVFSKDAIVHIKDKLALAREVMRVLTPGGVFAASDWLAGYEGEPSAKMQDYLAAEGLGFGLKNSREYSEALRRAGFVDVRINDRNAWYKQIARDECMRLSTELSDLLADKLGLEYVDHGIKAWQKMVGVLDSGELRPTNFYAKRPA